MPKKAEHMTILREKDYTAKNHPRIMLRGMLDSLHAKAVLCEAVAWREKQGKAAWRCADVASVCMCILGAEYSEEECQICFADMETVEAHERSHAPKKYYGLGHVTVSGEMGETMAHINELRAQVRQVERYAVDEFLGDRDDIIKSLNRLSSYVYVIMLELLKEREEQV